MAHVGLLEKNGSLCGASLGLLVVGGCALNLIPTTVYTNKEKYNYGNKNSSRVITCRILF